MREVGVEVAAEGDYYGRLIARGDFRGDQASLDVHVAAIDHIVASAEGRVSAAFPHLIRDLYGRAVERGHGADEIAAAIGVFRDPA